jgi:PAS domain S-box-containing protein
MASRRGTILVVDDEPESLALLRTILTEEGYKVCPADSGKLALASAAASLPDLILIDIRMPGMDGLEVCRRLKECESTREIPVIFVSGSTGTEERVQGLALGAVDFVVKPFFRDELLARVHTHLELGRLRSELEAQVASRTRELREAVDELQQEIAERRRTEKALRESEERFRNMANTAPVMLAVADADRSATFFNKSWLDFTGRTLDQELGDGWTVSVHPDDIESCLDRLSSVYATQSECRMEYRLRRADGEYRNLLCKGVPRFEREGAFAGYIASMVDITDLKRSQEAAVARQKLESLGVLAGGIAHDFNNLLGSIMADSELLLSELEEGSPALEDVERIGAVALRAAGIVRQLMVYAGQESGAFEQLDLGALIREMLEFMKVSISKKATLEIDLPDCIPTIPANPAQMRQVVMNLIANASEALRDREGVISVSLAHLGDCLRLKVSDTGCGMTNEVQAGIFDPFFTTKGPGRGLGLASVQGIVRGHGGAISVVSAPGSGSRFEIRLPCPTRTEREPDSKAVPAVVAAPATFVRTVLLIDDEDTLRLAIAKMLRRSGFSVFETGDGRAAIALFKARWAEIDIVLLDVTLAGISGREVLEALRNINPQAKVILTTAYGRDLAMATTGGDPSLLYLRKPYRIGDLAELLRETRLPALSDRATS